MAAAKWVPALPNGCRRRQMGAAGADAIETIDRLRAEGGRTTIQLRDTGLAGRRLR